MVPASTRRPASRALALVFLPFFLLGAFFTAMIVRDAMGYAGTYTWQPASCLIAQSDVRESTSPAPWFGYLRYTWSGGESVRSSRSFDTYHDAVHFTRRWPAGSHATCYLDPIDPAGTILEHNVAGIAMLLFLPLPLFFAFIGAAGFYSVMFRVQPKTPRWRTTNPIAARRLAAALLIAPGLTLFLAFLLGPVPPRHRRPFLARPRLQNHSQRSPSDGHA